MSQVCKGVVILCTLGLWAVSCNVQAGTIGELDKILAENIQAVIHQGTCKVGATGELVSDPALAKANVPCEAGIGDDPTIHFVLLYRNNRPDRLIRFEVNTKKQVIIWFFGTEV